MTNGRHFRTSFERAGEDRDPAEASTRPYRRCIAPDYEAGDTPKRFEVHTIGPSP